MIKIQISKKINIILFLLIALLIAIKFNLYNFTFLNKINGLIFPSILIIGVVLMQINIKDKIKYFFNGLLILISIFLLFFYFLGINMCGEEVLSIIDSSDKQYKLSIIERNCGATTGFSYIVLLEKKRRLFSQEKIVFKSYEYPKPETIEFLDGNTISIDNGFITSFSERTLEPNNTFNLYRGRSQ